MKVAIILGHSMLKNGKITSANGLINEYSYNKNILPVIVKYLKKLGANVTTITCPEKKFTSSLEEKPYKLGIVNKGNFDLVVELHLNATTYETGNGTEVYYISDKGKVFADRIQKGLSTIFRDRGAKKRTNLYILNQTKPTAILLELFFCTNKEDVAKSKDVDKIARLIAEGIMGKSLPKTTPPATSNIPVKTITVDSSVKDIKWLQVRLNRALPPIKGVTPTNANGVFDSKTRLAVLLFWEQLGWAKHLKNDGTRVGTKTKNALAKY